jgi:hypothetical protein
MTVAVVHWACRRRHLEHRAVYRPLGESRRTNDARLPCIPAGAYPVTTATSVGTRAPALRRRGHGHCLADLPDGSEITKRTPTHPYTVRCINAVAATAMEVGENATTESCKLARPAAALQAAGTDSRAWAAPASQHRVPIAGADLHTPLVTSG